MIRKFSYGLLIGLAISIILTILLYLNLFEGWQNRLSDTLFKSGFAREDIVIVGIDDKSIQTIGRWPWPRSIHAKLLKTFFDDNNIGGKPAVIGYDISFLEKSNDEKEDQELALALAEVKSVVLAADGQSLKLTGSEVTASNILLPIATFRQNASFGLVNTIPDQDSVTRKVPLKVKVQNQYIDSFSLKIIQKYLEEATEATIKEIPTERGLMRINFAGKPGTFPYYSFVDVLEGNTLKDSFKNKIVLIGVTAPNLHDNQLTPVSYGTPMTGAEIHANIIQTILNGDYLNSDQKTTTAIVVILLSVFLSLILVMFGIFSGIFFFLVVLVAYIIFVVLSFDTGSIKNIVFPPMAIVISGVANIVYKYFTEYGQKRYIKRALSYYLSNAVLKEILADPEKLKLGGSRRKITVLFSDIAGFTSISEKLHPETLANMLNQYLSHMTRVIFDHKGVLDKYIGDAIMAFWGAPIEEKDQALLACQTALEMQEQMTIFRKEWAKKNFSNFGVRIGINTGDMIVGNMGSDMRFDYTIIGDNVNLGSRLEGINNLYGTSIIMSEFTYNEVKEKVYARMLDTVVVKGKKKGVNIYELRGLGNATKKEQEFLSDFQEARLLYQDGSFKRALEQFKELRNKYPEDLPIQVYITRCLGLIKKRPKDWDGIYHAETK